MNFDYEINKDDDTIVIFWHDESMEEQTIELSKFWKWVVDNEYNEWWLNYYHPAEPDGHRQSTG